MVRVSSRSGGPRAARPIAGPSGRLCPGGGRARKGRATCRRAAISEATRSGRTSWVTPIRTTTFRSSARIPATGSTGADLVYNVGGGSRGRRPRTRRAVPNVASLSAAAPSSGAKA